MRGPKPTPALVRFDAKVDRLSTPDGCWLWTDYANKVSGYGQLGTGSNSQGTYKMVGVHRFALQMALGRPLAAGMMALHTCDVRMCCRNDEVGFYEVGGEVRDRRGHLWEGTHADNMLDMTLKARGTIGCRPTRIPAQVSEVDRNGRRLHPECMARGERVAGAKLTESAVREIRCLAASGVRQRDIALKFGVRQPSISDVLSGKTWVHVL